MGGGGNGVSSPAAADTSQAAYQPASSPALDSPDKDAGVNLPATPGYYKRH